MRIKFKKIISAILLSFVVNAVYSQQVTGVQSSCATAAQGTAGNFIISYTIGEMPLVQSWKTNGLFITQGVLQPFTTAADTTFECFTAAEVKVFPNPNPGLFTLQLSILKKGNMRIQLTDVAGRELQTDAFVYNAFVQKNYDISRLANGVYYLLLFFTEDGNQKLKKCSYTIQKLK